MSTAIVHPGSVHPYSRYLFWELFRRRWIGAKGASLLGPAWQLIQPVLFIVMLTLVLNKWANIPIDDGATDNLAGGKSIRYGILLCCGLLPWRSIATATTMSAALFNSNAQFLRRTRINPVVYVLVELAVTAVQFTLLFSIFIILAMFMGLRPSLTWIQLVPILGLQLLLCYGLQLGSAAAGVFARDLQYLYATLFQIWFWITPIAYRAKALNAAPKWVVEGNPLYHLVKSYRSALLYEEWISPGAWLILAGSAAAACLIGTWMYRSLASDIPDFV